ncbi:3-oxoadipate enol-lactonase [Rhizobiales bacterium RZME27]|uniref:3-oxoadipate enol-lactonase n=1 Tax=Endobacterium cereale TaxID=2663029 RepID=A0A6A8ACT7_9HYPH|nr:3-oxoadipate enol-lactonase [Endobacterium cereale]MEB2844141.1 3-oxoadipate enol-lactonase [Endobacterium cereale]MQY48554.1 3-oxoadipate enol-lactonase [Endobacterium cereale]
MQFVSINDVVIRYDVAGAGDRKPVIVFINSLGTDARIWDLVLPKLSEDFTLVSYDKRGHGLSDLGKPPYRIEDHAADLAGVIDHLGYANVIICGLSVGGLIAQSLYATRPDLVRALILSNTAHKIGTADMWNERIAKVEAEGLGPMVDGIMGRWFTAAHRVPENAAYRGYCNMLLRQPVAGYSGTCAAIRDADFTEVAKNIAVPTLCIAGAEDGSTPPELVRSLADLVPGSRYHVIENAAHIPCVEAPAAYAAVIREFLAQLPGE